LTNSPKLELAENLIYVPTEEARELKAAFWAKAKDNPLVDPEQVTLATVQQLLGTTKVNKLWYLEGFSAWFANSEEWRQKLEYALNVALDEMIDLLRNPGSQGSAKVRAFEVIARLADREPARVKEVKVLDDDIKKMSQKQLQEFIKKHTITLGPAKEEVQEESASKDINELDS
jgi:hypothetical protein